MKKPSQCRTPRQEEPSSFLLPLPVCSSAALFNQQHSLIQQVIKGTLNQNLGVNSGPQWQQWYCSTAQWTLMVQQKPLMGNPNPPVDDEGPSPHLYEGTSEDR